MGLTMTDEQEALARERAAGNGNYTMETVRTAVSLTDLLAELDATRQSLVETHAKLGRAESQASDTAKRLAEVEAEGERMAAGWEKCDRALAASQAECARLREALEHAKAECCPGGACESQQHGGSCYLTRALAADTFSDDGATTPEGYEDERQGEVSGT